MAAAMPVLLVHGGAGNVSDDNVQVKISGVRRAAQAGYDILAAGGSALDATVAAVHVMEDDAAFNAGYGACLNIEGDVEMDALLMEGKSLNAGAVGALRDVRHAIDAARVVMERTPHVLLVADAARALAAEHGVPLEEPGALVTADAQRTLRDVMRSGDLTVHEVAGAGAGGGGTVGAVAVDATGHVVSATSTGGTTAKMAGRVGDTALVGCGGYADDRVGTVSATGHGESIIKTNLAHSIIILMKKGLSAQEATEEALEEMGNRLGHTAGAITLSNRGDVGVSFISKRMAWAFRRDDEMHYGIDQDQHCVEIVGSRNME